MLLVLEVATSPSLCLSFPMVGGRMVLQEAEVSQIINVLSYLYSAQPVVH